MPVAAPPSESRLAPITPVAAVRAVVARFDPGEALVMDGWGAIVLEREGERTRLIARGHAPAGLVPRLYAFLLAGGRHA